MYTKTAPVTKRTPAIQRARAAGVSMARQGCPSRRPCDGNLAYGERGTTGVTATDMSSDCPLRHPPVSRESAWLPLVTRATGLSHRSVLVVSPSQNGRDSLAGCRDFGPNHTRTCSRTRSSSTDGGVGVALDRHEHADGTWAEVRVRDRGLGIPSENLPRIFEPYQRAGT